MENMETNQNDNIKSDIKNIQTMLNMKAPNIRFIYSAKNFRTIFLLGGIWASFFSILYEILITVYQPQIRIPDNVITICRKS